MDRQSELKKISDFIRENFGIVIKNSSTKELERVVSSSAKILNLNREQFKKQLLKGKLNSVEIEVLINSITIGESYFFREKRALELAVEMIKKNISNTRGGIKIWCAGCSTGEEPYSIAILLNENQLLNSNEIEIWGTDLNPAFLQKAEKGLYRSWSFRSCPPQIIEKYFRRLEKNTFELKSEITSAVKFKQLNLKEKIYPFPFSSENYFDFVFFRNVIIYFDEITTRETLEKIYFALKNKGYLIVGISELPLINFEKFKPEIFENLKLFKKELNYSSAQKNYPNNLNGSYIEFSEGKRSNPGGKLTFPSGKAFRNPTAKRKPPSEVRFEDLKELFLKGNYFSFISRVEKIKESPGKFNLSDAAERELLLMLCKAYSSIGDLNISLKLCQQALNNYNLEPKFFYFLATLFREKGEIEKALEMLDRALFLKKDFILARFLKANLLFRLNKTKQAKLELVTTLNYLNNLSDDQIPDEAEGMSAGSLKIIVNKMIED